jgi:dihydrodipicolinate synthase/N-acetylneuraminate lyase
MMNRSNARLLKGAYMKRYPHCILATCVVPWDERGELIEDLFRHEIREVVTHGTRHLYLFGTAGEGYAVSDRQYDRIVRVFHEEMTAGKGEPMVGVINMSLTTIQERIARTRDLGIKRFQISLPNWGALSESEVFAFFRQVCGKFPDCQFLHYNLMRTKRLVTPAEYAKLAEEHPNLVATKNSTEDIERIKDLLTLAPQLQHFLNETGFAFGSLIGECGLLNSLALLNWQSGHAFFEAGRRRDVDSLIATQRELSALVHDLIACVGESAHIDGAFDKSLWKLHDRRFPLRLLPPYACATDASFERFAAIMKEKYPRWSTI